MQLADIRLLSFDCYGTLIDWELGITETVSGLAAVHGVHPTDAEILSQFASHETHVQDANPTWTYPVILAETWRRMATSMGLPDSLTHPAQCERDAQAFASSVPNWPAFDDSHEALLDLQRQCKLVILSNVDNESFAGSNKRLDITFDAILTAQDIGSYKPDLNNFHVLLQRASDMECHFISTYMWLRVCFTTTFPPNPLGYRRCGSIDMVPNVPPRGRWAPHPLLQRLRHIGSLHHCAHLPTPCSASAASCLLQSDPIFGPPATTR